MCIFACPCLADLEGYTRKVKLIASGKLARYLKERGGDKLLFRILLCTFGILNHVNVLLIKILFLFIF